MNDVVPHGEEYQSESFAQDYLSRADLLPHRAEGEAVLLELLPQGIRRVADLGCGDGRLLALIRGKFPHAEGVAVDFSTPMLDAVQKRFAGDDTVTVICHDLAEPLPLLGRIDAAVSSLAIHHLEDARKCSLYEEIFRLLEPGGWFFNLEHVSSPTPALHASFYAVLGMRVEAEDPSNKLAPAETQLDWLRRIGFADVDCFWKWRELALLAGRKPRAGEAGES